MKASSYPADAERYTRIQIVLHWLVVALVLVQWVSADEMNELWDGVERGLPVSPGDNPIALLHAVSGATVLLLMLVRWAVRLRTGAPPLPADLHPALRLLARLNHYAFYAVLILMPLTGATAILAGVEASANLHVLLKNALLALVALHLAGVLFHMLVRRDGLLWRMVKPR